MATTEKVPAGTRRRTGAEFEAELAQAKAERDAAFAREAATAQALAQRNSEYDERIAQQAATIDELKAMSASPDDPQPVFDLIAARARDLCDAYGVTVLEFDGTLIHHRASTGVSDDPARREAVITSFPTTPAARLLTVGRAILERRIVRIDDLQAARAQDRTLALPDVKSFVAVPMMRGEAVIGVLSMGGLERGGFSDNQVELLKTFAEQAAIAITSAEAYREQREALDQQTATAEVLQVINSSPGDLAPVFDAILEKAHRFCGVAHGSLQLFEDGKFRAVAMRGIPEPLEAWLRQPHLPGSGLGPLLAGSRFHQLTDQAEAVAQQVALNPPSAWSVHGIRTRLFLPLRRDEALLGVIVAGREEARPFTEKEVALLENFAAQAVIAMENARLLGELRQRTDEVAELNRGLETRVAEQVEELGRVGRLKRFLAPQLAELIVSQGDETILESHRREIVVVFCDLRGYTAFTETAEPEEVLDFLREYHGALGPLVSQFEGTLDQFSGDGIMVFFNDPVPVPDPAERAVKMAVAMREAAATLIADWRERGRDLGFGAGIAQGYATLGQIGFSERSGYTAIGTVCNVAARLCAEAKDGQILLGQRVNVALKGSVATEQVGALALKGLTQPVIAYNVPLAATQPALRVIEGTLRSD
jgi:class 3 adenylate cyclase/putative methionine-R-sulfoxide reductase with GAF domain